jgi:hypothetical protein
MESLVVWRREEDASSCRQAKEMEASSFAYKSRFVAEGPTARNSPGTPTSETGTVVGRSAPNADTRTTFYGREDHLLIWVNSIQVRSLCLRKIKLDQMK